MLRKILLGLLVVLLGAQAFRPEKNLSAAPAPSDLLVKHPAPPAVERMLRAGCYDCHSDHTRYPWYAELQPLGWWLDQHVRDGKRALNLSLFGDWPAKRQASRLEEMVDTITQREMPLPSYTLGHPEAKFTEAQIQELTGWLEALRDKVAPEE